MEKKKRRRFTDEYKRDTIRMLEERQIPISKLARDMDLRVDLLYSWKRKYGKAKNSFLAKDESAAQLRKPQKRLRDVEEERDILKKAMAIFTQVSKPGTDS
jgi:transposase-like protein